jgi:hypothetical protein
MTLGNMRSQRVHHLIAFCHNDASRHQAVIDLSKSPADLWLAARFKSLPPRF